MKETALTAHLWQTTRDAVVAVVDKRDTEASALISFAMWAVDSICYLQEIDADLGPEPKAGYRGAYRGQLVEIAHARWAAASAITALDLCAAALARLHKAPPPRRGGEYDLANVVRAANVGTLKLPAAASAWVKTATGGDYAALEEVRHGLIHRRLRQLVSVTNQPVRSPVALYTKATGVPIPVPEIIDKARAHSSKHVEQFIADVAAGTY